MFSLDLGIGIQCFGMQMLVLEIGNSSVLLLIGDSRMWISIGFTGNRDLWSMMFLVFYS